MADDRPINPKSGEWVMFKRWLLERIDHLRDELETPGSPPEETRGRIAELRHLLRQVEPDLPEQPQTPTFSTGSYEHS